MKILFKKIMILVLMSSCYIGCGVSDGPSLTSATSTTSSSSSSSVAAAYSCTGNFIDIPTSGAFTDPEGDTSIDFVDITNAQLTIDNTNITFSMTLKNLPATFTVNQTGVTMNYEEYMWGIDFDTNNDGTPEYTISNSHFKNSDTPADKTFDQIGQTTFWKDSAGCGGTFLTALTTTLTGNTFSITVAKSTNAELANITTSAKVRIRARYRNATDRYYDMVGSQ